MTPLQRFLRLKDKAESLQRQQDRTDGELLQLTTRMQEETNCTSLKEAEQLQKKLKRERQEAERDFLKAEADFNEKWGGKLT
jgi:hypothetical protein